MKVVAVVFLCFTVAMLTQAKNSAALTVAEAQDFIKKAEARLAELNVRVNQAQWVPDNFITDNTEALAAATDELTAVTTELVEQGKRICAIFSSGGSKTERSNPSTSRAIS
jgi:hypothetical protein